MAAVDPKNGLAWLAGFAVLTGFAAATQDIVIDAWRIESAADADELGLLTSAYQWGYRIAIIVAGAVPLVLADHLGWNLAYGSMAGLMAIGLAAALAAPREVRVAPRAIPDAGLPTRRRWRRWNGSPGSRCWPSARCCSAPRSAPTPTFWSRCSRRPA